MRRAAVLVLLPCMLIPGCERRAPYEPGLPPAEAGQPSTAEAPFRFKGEAFTDLCAHTETEIGSDLEPSVSPDGKWIAFCSTRHDVQPDIYVKGVTGRAVIRKTFHPAVDCQPAFSPDGKRIAFCSNRNGDFDLFVMSVQGREAPQALTQGDGDEMHPTWSPDGSKIAYCAYDPRLGDWELRILDLATGSKTYLGVNGLYPEWSPDGRRLAFQRARERGEHWYAVWTVDIASSAASPRVEASSPAEVVGSPSWAAITPAWSRDGRFLVFATVNRSGRPRHDGTAWRGRGDDIWMVGADGSALVQLTRGGEAVSGPVWGSDDRVYFISDRSGHRCIWSLKPLSLEAGAP